MSIEARLQELGFELPQAPTPVANYLPGVVDGNHVWVSGQTARINGVRRFVGKVGDEISLEDAYKSARDAALNCLSIIKMLTGSLDNVDKIIKVVGFVNSAPGFSRQPECINGASDLLAKLFGEAGRHARSAVGVAELPSNVSVELEMVVRLKDR